MVEFQNKLNAYVSAQLLDAPDSAAKAELVEELSDNLYRRWLDMTAGGMDGEEAYVQAANELGDVDELVAYLKGLSPDEPLPKAGKEEGGELDDLLKSVEGVAKELWSGAKFAFREVKGKFSDRGGEPEEKKGHGMNFSINLDTGKGEFKMGGTPSPEDPEKDIVYGVGYDRTKGGFYAQWGQYKGRYNRPVESPVESAALRGIVVETVSGDVTVRMTEAPDGDVIIDGDVEDLDVRRSDDGVLTIGQGKTASASFFFGRGMFSADVVLYLPRRHWEFLKITTVSGNVDVDGDDVVDVVTIKTASGDVKGGIRHCGELSFKSVSGDLDWIGDIDRVESRTTSGDVVIQGSLGQVKTDTVSGDVRMDGKAQTVHCLAVSGDVWLRTDVLPGQMELSTRSGDCEIYLADTGSFSVRFHTVSGQFRSDFFGESIDAREDTLRHGEGGPSYQMVTTSGDVRLMKL